MTAPGRAEVLAAAAAEHAGHIVHWTTVYDGHGGVTWQDDGGLYCGCGWSEPKDAIGLRPWPAWHLHVVAAALDAALAQEGEQGGAVDDAAPLAREVERGAVCYHGRSRACYAIRCGSNCYSRFDRMHPCPACLISEIADLRANLAAAPDAGDEGHRSHYVYVNMRDVGCNCGERAGAEVRTKEQRDDWFSEHLTRVAPPVGGQS